MYRYIKYGFFLVLAGCFFAACTKMDETYKGFLEGGEKVYTAKPDSLQAFSGNKRLKISWLLLSDPKITKTILFWNNRQDSIVVPIHRSAGIDTIETIIPLEEGVYTFDVYNYDDDGDSSIRTEVIGEVYGETYQNAIHNRALNSATYYDSIKSTVVKWYGVDEQAVVMNIKYTGIDGAEKTITQVPVSNPNAPDEPPVLIDTTLLPGFKEGTSISYRTGYKPTSTSIDTFYTDYTEFTDIHTYVPPPPPPPAAANLALGKTVTVSSGDKTALTDGDRTNGSTKWQPSSSERADLNVWFYVDLGEAKDINKTQVYFVKDPNKITYYEVLTTNESTVSSSTKWTRAFYKSGAPDEEDINTFDKVSARYVKVNIGLRDSGTNINVAEVEVYNE